MEKTEKPVFSILLQYCQTIKNAVTNQCHGEILIEGKTLVYAFSAK
jgi:hypothetical protein